MDEAKRAFHAVEELDDEDVQGESGTAAGDGAQKDDDAKNKTNYREVGHNMYILAQQVCARACACVCVCVCG